MPEPRALDHFRTPRLLAERLEPAHWADLRRMDQDPAYMAMLGGVRGAPGTAEYLEHNLRHWAEHGFGLWMLREAGTGAMAGRAVLRHLVVEGQDEIETGYGFLPQWWGRGLATEVCRACVELGFVRLGLNSIVAITRPENHPSRRVLEKAEFRYERVVSHAQVRFVLYRIVRGERPSRPRAVDESAELPGASIMARMPPPAQA